MPNCWLYDSTPCGAGDASEVKLAILTGTLKVGSVPVM